MLNKNFATLSCDDLNCHPQQLVRSSHHKSISTTHTAKRQEEARTYLRTLGCARVLCLRQRVVEVCSGVFPRGFVDSIAFFSTHVFSLFSLSLSSPCLSPSIVFYFLALFSVARTFARQPLNRSKTFFLHRATQIFPESPHTLLTWLIFHLFFLHASFFFCFPFVFVVFCPSKQSFFLIGFALCCSLTRSKPNQLSILRSLLQFDSKHTMKKASGNKPAAIVVVTSPSSYSYAAGEVCVCVFPCCRGVTCHKYSLSLFYASTALDHLSHQRCSCASIALYYLCHAAATTTTFVAAATTSSEQPPFTHHASSFTAESLRECS